MKKVTLNKKLSLRKDTVANLSLKQMSDLKGGGSWDHISCGGHICQYSGNVVYIKTKPFQVCVSEVSNDCGTGNNG
jgi:natural product precursor